MSTNTSVLSQKSTFHFGHLGLVMLTALFVLGLSYTKNPKLFSFTSQPQVVAEDSNAPKYYAYEPDPSNNAPQVAGASTEALGPSVINEDGSISPALDGSVLGVSTEDLNTDLSAVKVQVIPDSPEAKANYISATQQIESSYLDSADFELALSTGNQTQISEVAQKLQNIVVGLNKLLVPKSYEKIHRLKIVQYNSGVALLLNYSGPNSDSDKFTKAFGAFLETQKQLEMQVNNLN